MRKYVFVLFVLMLFSAAFPQSGEVQETSKVVVSHFKFTDTGLVETRSSVVYGLPPDLQDEAAYTASVLDTAGSSLEKQKFSDPRIYMGDNLSDQGIAGITGFDPDAEVVLVLRFNTSMDKLVISNTTSGQKIFEANLSPLVNDFCASHPQDVDCAKIPPKQEGKDSGSLFLPALVVIVLAGIVVAFVLTRKKGETKKEGEEKKESGEKKEGEEKKDKEGKKEP